MLTEPVFRGNRICLFVPQRRPIFFHNMEQKMQGVIQSTEVRDKTICAVHFLQLVEIPC